MSIENEIKKLTAAVQENTAMLERVHGNAPVAEVPTAPAPVAEVPTAPAPAPAPVAEVPTAPAPAPAPAPAATYTPEQLNQILVEEFTRIGDRAPIDAAMQQLGVTSVTDLPADKQQALIDAVRAIQA